jgi:streptogramin lyase
VENNGGTTIVQIAAAVVNGAVGVTAVAPATVLASTVPPPGGLPTINNPWGIVFDISGNMWITNEQLSISACSGSVVEFTKAAIGGGGLLTPAANVVITQTAVGGTNSLCDPNGITMNKNGNIVVANAAGNSLAEYTASQITNSGNLTPHTLITGAGTLLNAPTGLTFGPLTLR